MKWPKAARLVAVTLWAASLWPLWRWWWRRLDDPLDAGTLAWFSIPPLLALLWLNVKGKKAHSFSIWKLWLAVGGMLVFAVTRSWLPLTLGALPAVLCGLPLLMPEKMSQGKVSVPILGLAAMGLPSVMILDLLLGMPLRWVAVWTAGEGLRFLGCEVVREGMGLVVDGVSVWVDAPCAGVKMLGMGMWLVLVLAQLFQLNAWRTFMLGALAVVALVVCNVARVSALTLLASRGCDLSLTWHQLVGLFAMVPGVALCAGAAMRMENGECKMENGECGSGRSSLFLLHYSCYVLSMMVVGGYCVLAGGRSDVDGATGMPFPGWPSEFEGERLEVDGMSADERGFAKEFPGKVARFRAGKAVVIMRWTDRVTHRVHSASACLSASGWQIEPLPVERRADGDWSAFLARKGSATLRVREQARSSDGKSFPDVPSWFYSALLGRSRAPWWIITQCEAIPPPSF